MESTNLLQLVSMHFPDTNASFVKIAYTAVLVGSRDPNRVASGLGSADVACQDHGFKRPRMKPESSIPSSVGAPLSVSLEAPAKKRQENVPIPDELESQIVRTEGDLGEAVISRRRSVAGGFGFLVSLGLLWISIGQFISDKPSGEQQVLATPPRFQLNLNHANAAQLQALPEVGARLADRIVRYRETHGPFRSVDELAEVHGIGERTITRLREMLIVSEPSDHLIADVSSGKSGR